MSALPGTAVSPGARASGSAVATVSQWLAPVLGRTRQDGSATGSVSLHHFGYLRLIVCETGPLCLTRDTGSIAQDSGDAIAVLIPRHGTVRLVQDGRGSLVESGQPALIDLRRAFSVEQRERTRLLFFRLPAHALHLPVSTLRTVTARALAPTHGVAALLVPLLLSLEESAARMPAAVGERLGGIVTELVAALVQECTESAEEGGESPRTGRRQLILTIREYIDRHLDDPELSAERIAAAHFISVRHLHRLFEDEGVTVGRLMLRRQVDECARELARRARVSRSISVVASRWGFRNAAHFSRTFMAVYGCSPQEWRREAGAQPGAGSGAAA
ncbi:helix-turn-helix domain-containing protein [Streptomyces sp. NRRL S-813]|uniref:helix-turn-helix domain-containing protein n=1 Tax=Streptomyces sp. NRRL S-813 TaxID=1463919 RepID=UPI000A6F8F7F|nr:helix-turn-helix domain-containing protein [Streptomyces sp. NRRL S-813]